MKPAQTPPHTFTLILLTATATLSLNMFLPSLANIAETYQQSYALVSVSVSGYLAVTAVIYLIAGPLSDRVGRRPVVLAALFLFAVSSVICAIAPNVWVFLGARLVQGGMIAGSALSMAIVRDTRSTNEAAGTLSTIAMAMAIAPMVGPVIGGLLDTAFGWRASFVAYALAGFGLLVLCWIDLGETRPKDQQSTPVSVASVARLTCDPTFLPFALCTALSTGAFYIFVAGAPLVAQSALGVSTAQLGFYIGSITAGFMTGAFISRLCTAHVSLTWMMLSGRLTACLGLSAGLVALSLGWLSPPLFFASTIFVGLGNGLTMPSSNAGALSAVPGLTGSAAGVNGAMTVALGAILTQMAGVVLVRVPTPETLIIMMLSVSALGLVAALVAHSQSHVSRDVA